jgi:hypothetical protein
MTKNPEAMLQQFRSKPRNADLDERKKEFDLLNVYVTHRGGWIVSTPGSRKIVLETLLSSTLPQELRDGLSVKWRSSDGSMCRLSLPPLDVHEEGEGQRILAGSIVENFARRADGELQPLVEGSTAPIAETRTHAGICKVRRFGFDMT